MEMFLGIVAVGSLVSAILLTIPQINRPIATWLNERGIL